MGPNRPLKVDNLSKAFSKTFGKLKNRNVWPVGAVSNMITEYSIVCTCLTMANTIECQGEINARGTIKDNVNGWLLHNFSKPHGFIYTWDCKRKILHH